jgi:hypothetical protein
MSLHPHWHFFTALRHLHHSVFGAALTIVLCAAVGVTMGILFPLSIESSVEERGNFKTAPGGFIKASAAAASPVVEGIQPTSEQEKATSTVATPSTSPRHQRATGKSPIKTSNPCRWSQSADGTLTCAGRLVMPPGTGNALHMRQCGMVFYDKVSFSGVDIHVVSRDARKNPFLVHSSGDWKINLDEPNATEISVTFTAEAPEPGNVVCQFSYRVQKVP